MQNHSTIFGDFAMKYFDQGYNVIPLRYATKIPQIQGWQQFSQMRQAEFQVESFSYTYSKSNIGIPLGEQPGVIALDFDYEGEGLQKKVIDLLGPMPVKKKGAKGFTAFFRYNGELPKKWYHDGKAVVELLSTGNQTVMPPSIHPDTGEPYTWLTPDTLLDLAKDDLPKLPVNFCDMVDSIFGYDRKLERFSAHAESHGTPELVEVTKALTFIPSSEYATWLTIGMALHHTYGDAAFPTWDAWSRKASNYDEKIMNTKWASFGRSKNVVTIGTLFHHAIGCGYIPPVDESIFTDSEDGVLPTIIFSKPLNSVRILETEIGERAISEFPKHLLNAPGMPGEIASWINGTSLRRQPILALGAALCASGTIFSHRVRNDSNLRTNLMVLGLAESGTGKNHARDCIKSLFQSCNINQYLLGKFTSDTALLNTLSDTNGIGFAMMEEMGREIKCLNSSNAGSHEARLLTMMMELYTEAGSCYIGKKFANSENAKIIEQPCLNIYGTTVPKRFFDSLTSDDAIDGFLARWLVFASDDIDPPMQERGNVDLPPLELMENIKFILAMNAYKEVLSGGHLSPRVPAPRIIPYTEGASDVLNKFTKTCNENRIAEIKKGSDLAPIWARTREHAIKLALVAHPYREGVIETVTMTWACELAMYLSQVAISAIKGNISDTEYEKNLKRILNIIRKINEKTGEPCKSYKIAESVRTIKPKERNEIIAHLVESGMVQVHEFIYNGKISYAYTAN